MEKCGHYDRWREDFALVRGARLRRPALRPAAAPHLARPRPLRLGLRRRRPSPSCAAAASCPIVDLCHFGVPDWIGDFQNPDFPALFADYAARLRRALPLGPALHPGQRDVHLPPSSPPATAGGTSSCTTDRGFVTALKHLVKANVLAMQAILEVRPDAIFIQSESTEYFHADNPAAIKPGRGPQRRALPVARPQLRPPRRSADVRVPDRQRHDARGVPLLPRATGLKHHCIMGNDYYVTNEHLRARRRPRPRRRRDLRLRRASPGSTTTATACR